MSKKPTVLMILDGYGLNDKHEGNAIYEAKTPVMDKLMAEYPFVKGNASGLAVGLPDGQMGNSEVGHMNMGAGRIVYQELTRITKEINDGDFFRNEALLAAMKNAKDNDSAVHFMGLLSDGGVHSHNTHLYALLEMAKREGLNTKKYASATIVLDLFNFYGQTVVNFKSSCNSKKDSGCGIKYNKSDDSFTIKKFEEKKQSIKITDIQTLGNNYYKVVATVSGAGSISKVNAIIQRNKLDSSLGFSIKALKWS